MEKLISLALASVNVLEPPKATYSQELWLDWRSCGQALDRTNLHRRRRNILDSGSMGVSTGRHRLVTSHQHIGVVLHTPCRI